MNTDDLAHRVRALRNQTITAKEFSEPFEAYLDLVESGLLPEGEPCKDPRLVMVLQGIGQTQMSGRAPVSLMPTLATALPSLGLTHGMFFVEGRPGAFYYFPEDDLGLCAVQHGLQRTHYLRFSVCAISGTVPARGRAS